MYKKAVLISLLLFVHFFSYAQTIVLTQNFDDPNLLTPNSPQNLTVWSKGGDLKYVTDNSFNNSKHLQFKNNFDLNWFYLVTDSIDFMAVDSVEISFNYISNNALSYFISEENKFNSYGNHYNLNNNTDPKILKTGILNTGNQEFRLILKPQSGIYRIQVSFVETPDLSQLKIDNFSIIGFKPLTTSLSTFYTSSTKEIYDVYTLEGQKVEIQNAIKGNIYIIRYSNGETLKTNWR